MCCELRADDARCALIQAEKAMQADDYSLTALVKQLNQGVYRGVREQRAVWELWQHVKKLKKCEMFRFSPSLAPISNASFSVVWSAGNRVNFDDHLNMMMM